MLNKFLEFFRPKYVLNYKFIDNQSDKTVLLIHGLGLSLNMWKDVIKDLGKVNILAVDLIGHGDSPNPEKDFYDLNEQTRSVLKTIKQIEKIKDTKLILVGYSLGSLVAIELASRKPKLFSQVVLCSPPVYQKDQKSLLSTDKRLITIYEEIIDQSDKTGEILKILAKNKFIYDFEPTEANVVSFMKTLQNSIIKQDVFAKLCALDTPTTIIYGAFDLLINPKNLKLADKSNSDIKLMTIPFSHSVIKPYAHQIAKVINGFLDEQHLN